MKSPMLCRCVFATPGSTVAFLCAVASLWAAPKPRLHPAWAHSLGSTNQDAVQCVAVTPRGDVFISGFFHGQTQIGDTRLKAIDFMDVDAFLAKLDSRGEVLWAQAIQGFASTTTFALAIDAQGNVLLTGKFFYFVDIGGVRLGGGPEDSFGMENSFIAKFNPDGTHLWSRATQPVYRYAFTAAFDSAGEIYVGGSSNLQAVVAKYSADGELLYTRQLTFIPSFVMGTAIDRHDHWFISALDRDNGAYVARLTPQGEQVWARRVPSGGRLDTARNGIVAVAGQFTGQGQIENGPLLQADLFNPSAYLASFNDKGKFLEASVLATGYLAQANAIALDRTGNWFVAGEANRTGYLATPRSSLVFGPGPSGGGARPKAIALDRHNNVYMAGEYFSSADLLGTHLAGRSTTKNGFVVKFNVR